VGIARSYLIRSEAERQIEKYIDYISIADSV
jgi:hypothetical protein